MENRKEQLRMVIEEYWKSELPKVKARDIRLKVESDLINDVIGPRRAGKTYLDVFDHKGTFEKRR